MGCYGATTRTAWEEWGLAWISGQEARPDSTAHCQHAECASPRPIDTSLKIKSAPHPWMGGKSVCDCEGWTETLAAQKCSELFSSERSREVS